MKKRVILWIDPICDPQVIDVNSEFMLAINDCRNDIAQRRKTTDDKKRENVYFESFQRNFWPYIAVITNRCLQKGEEICVYYSHVYSHLIQENPSWDEMQAFVEELTETHAKTGIHK